jgi:tetratricopeptide (TPR) repeat protein
VAQVNTKPSLVLGSALVLSVAAAAVTTLWLAPEGAGPTLAAGATVSATSNVGQLEERLVDLARRVERLERDLAVLPTSAPARQSVLAEGELEALVERLLDQRATDAEPPATAAIDVASVVRELLDPNASDEQKRALWAALTENGQLDAVVAEFERRADLNPYDSMVQTELGWAYGQKMIASSGPEAGRWGAKLAESFARALELDDTNWDARFSLATHEYWAGLAGDSVRNLERLVEQQKTRTSESRHVRAFLFLGNLYMDRGDADGARRVWSDGLAHFPNDASLAERLKAFE